MEETKAINIEQLRKLQGVLQEYKNGKANLDNKLIANEDWWKLNHFRNFKAIQYERDEEGHIIPIVTGGTQTKQSSWLFNSIMNKHADVMDNYPEPAILPREESDKRAAETLSSVLPVVLENCNFEQTYSDAWWDKLVNGTAVYGITWNQDLLNGLGDIEIKQVDMLSMYWEPGVQDIQDSRYIFILSLEDKDLLQEEYPQLEGKLTGTTIEKKKYHYDDSVNTDKKAIVVDCYYKVSVENQTGGMKETLQFVKFVNDEVLYSSEDDENHPEFKTMGFYNHGKYPFVMDTLFREKGTPAAFGYVDVMKSTQEDIDEMRKLIKENAEDGVNPRYFEKDEAAINEEEFNNKSKKIVHVASNLDEVHIKPIDHRPLDGAYLNFYQMQIDELKETSGNRDFSQGSTASGVTSGSAISALIEAGSKGSRDMIKGAYRAFAEVCTFCIELMRQFYNVQRTFRVTNQMGQDEFVQFDASMINGSQQMIGGELFSKEPVFDIKVKAQKSSPYARLSQNELAIQFFNLGFFNPQMSDQALATIDMMDFEGKDKVIQKIQMNGTMYQQIQQMQQTMAQMAGVIAQSTGDTRLVNALATQNNAQPIPSGGRMADMSTDAMGQPNEAANTAAKKMKQQIQGMSGVR